MSLNLLEGGHEK